MSRSLFAEVPLVNLRYIQGDARIAITATEIAISLNTRPFSSDLNARTKKAARKDAVNTMASFLTQSEKAKSAEASISSILPLSLKYCTKYKNAHVMNAVSTRSACIMTA